MLFTKATFLALVAAVNAAPTNVVSPWQAYHDEQSCARNHYYWGADQRCIERKEDRQNFRDQWRDFTNPASCAQHGFRWDVNHGCGPLSGLAGTLPRPYKRDTSISPWEAYHDQESCARNHYFWGPDNRCVEHREARQEARQDWHDFRDEGACASHGFHWDVRHGCGPIVKREVTQWRAGPWDGWHDRRACEEHAYRWDAVSNRCAEVVAANAAGAIGGAIAAGVGALTGGIADAVGAYNTEAECAGHSHRWDREHGRCY